MKSTQRGHPNYHRYYQTGEYARLHEHSAAEKLEIIRQLKDHGIQHHHIIGRLLKVSANVSSINSFFHTEIMRYEGPYGHHFLAASHDVQFNSSFEIIGVYRLHTYPQKRISRATPNGPVGDPTVTDYSWWRMMYSIPEYLDGAGQSVAVVGQPILFARH